MATFHSVSQALRFEKLLLEHSLPVRLIPVPRVISSSCGIAARFDQCHLIEVSNLAAAGQAGVEGVFLFTQQGKKLCAQHLPGPWDEDGNSQ